MLSLGSSFLNRRSCLNNNKNIHAIANRRASTFLVDQVFPISIATEQNQTVELQGPG